MDLIVAIVGKHMDRWQGRFMSFAARLVLVFFRNRENITPTSAFKGMHTTFLLDYSQHLTRRITKIEPKPPN
jgi:hypothetical protein